MKLQKFISIIVLTVLFALGIGLSPPGMNAQSVEKMSAVAQVTYTSKAQSGTLPLHKQIKQIQGFQVIKSPTSSVLSHKTDIALQKEKGLLVQNNFSGSYRIAFSPPFTILRRAKDAETQNVTSSKSKLIPRIKPEIVLQI